MDSLRIAQPDSASSAYTQALANHLAELHPLINDKHASSAARRYCIRMASKAMDGFPAYSRTQATEAALDLQRRRQTITLSFDRMRKQRDVCTRNLSGWVLDHTADDEQQIRKQAETWHRLLTHLDNIGAHRLHESHKGMILDKLGVDQQPKKGITARWLRRRLRFSIRQAQESMHLVMREVGHGRQEYASNWTTDSRREQIDTQRRWMECTTIKNGNNPEESFKLSDIARNAKARLAEALAVTSAMEKIGQERGLEMLFITITLPPEFHPNPQTGSDSWEGYNPTDGQSWITKRWARVRASIKKKGIENLYVRTAEPHKDSAPHWHVMLWTDDKEQTETLIRKHFQHGEHAVKIQHLSYKNDDNAKASAASYLLKYIIKTLPDDKSVSNFGQSKATQRIDAWRATYGVRALQYGGLPRGAITAWRESRRAAIGKNIVIPMESIPLLTAAKNGDFQSFIDEMTYQQVRLLKRRNLWTAEEQEAMGPDEGQQVVGIQTPDWQINTHTKTWAAEFDAKAFYENLNKTNKVTIIDSYPRGGDRPDEEGGKPGNSFRDKHETPPNTAPPHRRSVRITH